MNAQHIGIYFVVLGVLALECVNVAGGNGSETTNGYVVGRLIDGEGSPATQARVMLIASNHNPVDDGPIPDSLIDTTDESGSFNLHVTGGGEFNIEAVQPLSGNRALVVNLSLDDNDTVYVPDHVLEKPGAILLLPASATAALTGYVYLPGTTRSAKVIKGTTVLDSIPSGSTNSVVYIDTADSSDNRVLAVDVAVLPGNSAVIADSGVWKNSKKIHFNTTASGAGIPGMVVNFPVLIRLTAGNFDFSQTNAGGDLRFVKDDGTQLPCEIERWDPVSGLAEVWVKVDTVFGNDSTQSITMYWGNDKVADGSNSAAVFDTSSGFQAVWHLSGTGNNTVPDATANGYHGTPYNMDVASVVEGAIGKARDFDGTTSYIAIENSATGKLDMPQNGNYSLSLWAYADTIDTLWHEIAGKGHEQYYLKMKCFKNGKATWEFVEFQDQKGWEYTEDSIPPAPGAKQWVYLTGVRAGLKQYLYINGVLVNDSLPLMTGAYPRNTDDDFTIGRHARKVTIPYGEGWCYFNGKIDEVRVMNSVPGADWVRLCYMNQKAEDALVEFR